MTCPYPIVVTSTTVTLTFNDSFDANGHYWTWTDLIGWYEPSLRQSWLEPVGVDGSILAESREGSRPIVINGFCGVADNDHWWTAQARLETLATELITANGTIAVHAPPAAKSMAVRIAPGGIGLKREGGGGQAGAIGDVTMGFRFQLPLIAPTPTKSSV